MEKFKKIVIFVVTLSVVSSIVTFCEALFTGDAIYTGWVNEIISKIFQITIVLCGGIFIHLILNEKYGINRRFKFMRFNPYCKYCGERIGYFGKYRHCCDEEENKIDGVV